MNQIQMLQPKLAYFRMLLASATLNPEQHMALRQFAADLRITLDLVRDKDGGGDEDQKEAGKDIPKDDAAKERMKTEQELEQAKLALKKYGRQTMIDKIFNAVLFDDPDVLILKFLRARKWQVSAGVAMLFSMIKWRTDSDVASIVVKGEEASARQHRRCKLRAQERATEGTKKWGRFVASSCWVSYNLPIRFVANVVSLHHPFQLDVFEWYRGRRRPTAQP